MPPKKDKNTSTSSTASSSGRKLQDEQPDPINFPDANANIFDWFKFIDTSVKEIPQILKKEKSVTSVMREKAIRLAGAVQFANRTIRAMAVREFDISPDDMDDTIIVPPHIQEHEPASHPSADEIRSIVRQELAVVHHDVVQRMEKQSAESTAASYASIASKPKRPAVKTPVTRPALILKPEKEDDRFPNHNVRTSEQVLKIFKDNISFRNKDFVPAKVQTLGHETVRIEFDTQQQADAICNEFGHKTGVRMEAAKHLRPLIVLKGISKDVQKEDVTGLLLRQNSCLRDVEASDVKLLFVRRNHKDSLFNAVLEVSGDVRLRVLSNGRVNIDSQRVHVSDFSPLRQCFKCLQFGHTTSKCDSDVSRCSHCASDGHTFSSCPSKEDASRLKCFNCSKNGCTSGVQHSATSSKYCPKIKAMEKKIASRINYGQSRWKDGDAFDPSTIA